MRRFNYVPSLRVLTAVWAFAGAIIISLLVLLITLQIRTQDRLETSETETAALAAQLRDMGVEPTVDVGEGDNPPAIEGPPGPSGKDGTDGQDGDDGRSVTGSRGPRGFIGPVGPSGPPGRSGTNGSDGQSVTGPVGPQGQTGDQGPAGPAGPEGQQGPAGTPGKDGNPGPACPAGYTPRERTVITAENPLGEPAIVCTPEG